MTIQPIQPGIPSQPIQEEYNGKLNELQNKVEAEVKNAEQDTKEEMQNFTPSLTDMQTTKVAAEVTQNKIDAYKAGSGNSEEDTKNTIDISIKLVKDYEELKQVSEKSNGIKEYLVLC